MQTLWIRPSLMMEQLIFLYSSYSASTSFTETPEVKQQPPQATNTDTRGHATEQIRCIYLQQRDSSARSASSPKVRRPLIRSRWRARAPMKDNLPGGRFWKQRAAANATASTTASNGKNAMHASSPSVRELLDSCTIREQRRPDQTQKMGNDRIKGGGGGGAITKASGERGESMRRAAGSEPSIDGASLFLAGRGRSPGSSRIGARPSGGWGGLADVRPIGLAQV